LILDLDDPIIDGSKSNAVKKSHRLLGGLEYEFYFPFHIWDVILPIDEVIFFKMLQTINGLV